MKLLAVAASLALSGAAANAVTLVFDYSGTATVSIPDAYADLNSIWTENADFDDFFGTIIVSNFENYAVGSHTLSIAASNSPLELSLVNGLLTGIEGTRSRTTGAFVPDNSQTGDVGALTIVDGQVTGFTWAALTPTSPAISAFNSRLFVNAGFPVQIGSINVTVGAPLQTAFAGGEVIFAQNVRGTASVIMTPVPEASTYAMMLAGLGAMGFIARRRKSA